MPADLSPRRLPRRAWGRVAAIAALMGLVVAAGCADDADNRAAPFASGGGEAAAATSSMELEVELGDIWVRPAALDVEAGAVVTMHVTNVGAMPHDLVFPDGTGTRMLDAGERETIVVGPFTTSVQGWCTVPGHREAGMTMDIVMVGAETVAAADHGGQLATSTAGDHAVIDFNAAPSVEWQPYDPGLAPAPGGVEHEITLVANEVVLEVAPGVTQEMWVYNDMFPGPVLRGKVGDLFTVTLVNEGRIGHSIDFHSSKVAWNDEMRTIGPGEHLVYQFEAKHAGVYMYHCGTPPALHHIGNGMFGAMIVDPPDLPEVDHEYVFVQSEIYTGPMGEPGDLGKMTNDAWDAVVFNGYVNQYLHAPIRVEADERIRAFVLNAGPSENSSFHIVGTIFDTTYKEGLLLLQPDDTHGGAQALDLQPAQGGYVEFTFDVDGLYPIVTHKFSNVGKGALGLFQAGEVDADDAGGH